MMKNLLLKSLIATCVTGISILLTPKTSVAQVVDINLLKEFAESCQRDVFSSEYHQQMGYKGGVNPDWNSSDFYFNNCIKARYFYLKVISKLPWLVSTDEMIPGYPGVVAVSQMAYNANNNGFYAFTDFLDCLSTRDSSSRECTESSTFKALYSKDLNNHIRKLNIFDDRYRSYSFYNDSLYVYMCPSCHVAYNNNPSGSKMIDAFMEWFFKLESSHRTELKFTLLGGEQTPKNNRINMKNEAQKAWEIYKAERQKIAEQEKERRRRAVFE